MLGVYLICLGKNVKEDYYTIMYAFVGRLQILIQDRIVIAHLTQIEKNKNCILLNNYATK